MSPATILVIEDDPVVSDVIKRVLNSPEYVIHVAADGHQGLALFASAAPDLVITDLIMPEKEGIETIVALRKLNGAVKILAISGGGRIGNTDLLNFARQLGANDTLAKPFLPAELIGKVKQLLSAAT